MKLLKLLPIISIRSIKEVQGFILCFGKSFESENESLRIKYYCFFHEFKYVQQWKYQKHSN